MQEGSSQTVVGLVSLRAQRRRQKINRQTTLRLHIVITKGKDGLLWATVTADTWTAFLQWLFPQETVGEQDGWGPSAMSHSSYAKMPKIFPPIGAQHGPALLIKPCTRGSITSAVDFSEGAFKTQLRP